MSTTEPKRSVTSRLLQYLLLFKKSVAVALVILVLAIAAQLAGPLVSKNIIDNHILAIQLDWFELTANEVPEQTPFVSYRDRVYVRSDWVDGGMPAGAGTNIIHIRQEGKSFVLDGGSYDGERLTPQASAAFYRHDVSPVLQLIGLIVLLTAISSVLTFIQSYMLQSTAQRIVQNMRMDLYRHLHRLPMRFFDSTPLGQIVSRVANDTENIKELYMSFMATFVVSGMNIAGVFVALFFLDWRLALLCMVVVPIYSVIIYFHLKYSHKYVAAIRARLAEMNAMLNETIHVMPVLQAFRREAAANKEFGALNDNRYRNQLVQLRIFTFSGRNAVYFIGRTFAVITIWYYGGASLESAISFGVFYAFIDYLGRLNEPIVAIFDQMLNAQRAVVSAERVFDLMDEQGIDVAAPSGLPRPRGHVEFDRVSFGYKSGEYVLRDIGFEAQRGQTIALVGHTGSGKSSIMNLLLGFYEPQAGEIRIDGRPISQLSKQDLRRHMGIVLQDPFLFAGDIRFNVRMYNETLEDGKVLEALREVGAEPLVRQLANGLSEQVVERGSTLSAGQRQLISFARALAFDPAILILDEATSSIDSETEQLIQHALHVLREGRTTFIIAHRLSTIKDADLILVLHRGEIVERGTHDSLMEAKGRYYRMYQLQSNELPTG